MKNIHFVLFLTLFSFNSIGQVWIDTGAVWHYDYWTIGGFGFEQYEYTQDTIIDSKNCQMITGTRYVFGQNWEGNAFLLGIHDLGNQFTYVSGDTVFYLNNGEFFILYNFGASIGESWIISTISPQSECDDTSRIVVVDTGIVTLNSVDYRFITVQPTSNSSMGFSGKYVERFGNMDTTFAPFQYLFPNGFQCDSLTSLSEWIFYKFKCFEDRSFTLYNPSSQDCQYFLTHLGFPELNQNDFLCYPNPTSGLINIKLDCVKNIEIANQIGQVIFTGNNKMNIDLSEHPNGIYFIKITTNDKTIVSKIIKQ